MFIPCLKRNVTICGVINASEIKNSDVLHISNSDQITLIDPSNNVVNLPDLNSITNNQDATADIKTALDFIKSPSTKDLVLLCPSGLKKSPALLLVILSKYQRDAKANLRLMLACRPPAIPDLKLLELGLKFLKLDLFDHYTKLLRQ